MRKLNIISTNQRIWDIGLLPNAIFIIIWEILRPCWTVARSATQINPKTGAAVVVRVVDWGPDIDTKRIMDLSPQAKKDLGLKTDDEALVAFVDPSTPLGPSHP